MELGMKPLKIGDGQTEVTFSGRNGTVAKQVLDVAETGVILDEVCGTGVPPDMRRDQFLYVGTLSVPFDHLAQRVRIQRMAPV
jgi:hypothetical protein